jgi:hypothetical protein
MRLVPNFRRAQEPPEPHAIITADFYGTSPARQVALAGRPVLTGDFYRGKLKDKRVPVVTLTGRPAFKGIAVDADGLRYAEVQAGTGPDAITTIWAPDAGYCALMAEAFTEAHDALNPVPQEMGGQS